MLIRFVVENFLSFKEEAEFNMLSGSFKIHKEHLYKEKGGISLLKVAALYGANGSGKSNFVLALDTLKKLILLGTHDIKDSLPYHYFLLNKTHRQLPVKFEIEFSIYQKMYAYSISFFKNYIQEEWLYETHPKKEDKLVFERTTDKDLKTTINLHPKYLKTAKARLKAEIYAEEIHPNQPFFTEARLKNLPFVKAPWQWFDNVLEVIFPKSKPYRLFENLLFNESFQQYANQIFEMVKTGVKKVEVQEIPVNQLFGLHEQDRKTNILNRLENDNIRIEEGDDKIDYGLYLDEKGDARAVKLITKHQSNGSEIIFDFNQESDGTRRFIELTPALIDSIFNGKVYVIDEFNQSMHPQTMKKMIELYLNSDNNLSKGQLIFTTHETNLLDLKLFRQDEIWFVDKNKAEVSSLYSLSDFKPRYDKDIRRGYLNGRFGGIPYTSPAKLSP